MNVTVRTHFAAWAGSEGVTFAGDANCDGIADGIAWLLGARSPTANPNPLLPAPSENHGALEVRFSMRNLSIRGAAVLRLHYGNTLGS